jgi:hypothetical protein
MTRPSYTTISNEYARLSCPRNIRTASNDSRLGGAIPNLQRGFTQRLGTFSHQKEPVRPVERGPLSENSEFSDGTFVASSDIGKLRSATQEARRVHS